jgi:hypothetical protein
MFLPGKSVQTRVELMLEVALLALEFVAHVRYHIVTGTPQIVRFLCNQETMCYCENCTNLMCLIKVY